MDELKCPLCLSAVENEVHFVLCCPAFEDLRYEFIESKSFNNPCEFRFALLLATQNERALKNLALFLYKAFSRRKTCYREEFKCTSWINIQECYYNILCIYFRSRLVQLLIPASVICLLCVCIVYCLIRFIVLTPLQMGLWPYWIKFPYSVFSVSCFSLLFLSFLQQLPETCSSFWSWRKSQHFGVHLFNNWNTGA